jgi:toxin ParE1/3/4
MVFQVIVRNRATQDIRQQANYILVNGNRELGEKFLEFVESAFAQLAITPNMGKVVSSLSDMGTIRQWRIKNFKDYLIFYNPHSAPQTVPEGNYGDEKSKLA